MKSVRSSLRRAVSVLSVLLLLPVGALLMAQSQQPAPPSPPAPNAAPPQQLSPEQLSNLVAPIALYPDSLLSQVLVASTYPLEVVEAGQWLQQNKNLRGQALVDAAKQQNWDPSVQALVVFPDVLNRMNSDIRWTTDLGNAFLAQQADVMASVQRLRSQAQANGKLSSNSQQTVTEQTQGDQSAIQIVPADPQVIYVPVYNPEYIWGPPVWGYYPPLWYPAWGFGFGFGPGIYIGGFFGGWGGWGGWGWGCNWWGGGIYTNAFFFNHYGFHGFGPGFRGGVWAHNPEHRLGVPYANRGVASRFGSASSASRFTGGQRFSGATNAGRGSFGATAPQSGGWRRFGQPGSSSGANAVAPNRNSFAGQSANRGASNGGNGGWNRFGGSTAPRSTPVPNGGANRSAPSFNGGAGAYRSAPSNGGGSYRPAPSFGGGRSAAPSFSGGRSAPSFSGGRSAPSFGGGGGGFRGSAGGGGGFHGGGGGGSRGGGGSHGGGRR